MKKLSIGKVSKIVNLPQSVLRYWETVFEQLNPEKSEGGTRRYTQKDVDNILNIKNLLYKKKIYHCRGNINFIKSTGKKNHNWK